MIILAVAVAVAVAAQKNKRSAILSKYDHISSYDHISTVWPDPYPPGENRNLPYVRQKKKFEMILSKF